MIEIERITRYIDKIRPWPWRRMVAITVGSFLLASLVSTLLGWWFLGQTKKAQYQPPIAVERFTLQTTSALGKIAVDKVLERNIFNSEGLTGDVDSSKSGDQVSKTSLPLRVIGIIYGGNTLNGIAMVENKQSRSVNSFMVGDMLTPDAKLLEIQPDLILLENLGRKEFAPLEDVELRRSTRHGGKKKANAPETLSGSGYTTDAPPESYKEEGFERKGGNIELTAEYKNRLLTTDFANVLQDAKASPNMVDGVLKGWRMDRIRKNSFYEKSGMQNGDVVEEINGVVLSDAGQSIKLMQSLKGESEIDIKINRNGEKKLLNLKVR